MESEKSSEFRERGSVFKQMAEMKKKIQLVEGERKAIFEDCESEKQENKDKIKKLKDEVKQLQVCHSVSDQKKKCILVLRQNFGSKQVVSTPTHFSKLINKELRKKIFFHFFT